MIQGHYVAHSIVAIRVLGVVDLEVNWSSCLINAAADGLSSCMVQLAKPSRIVLFHFVGDKRWMTSTIQHACTIVAIKPQDQHTYRATCMRL